MLAAENTALIHPLHAALGYRAQGYAVIPVRAKRPTLRTWQQYQLTPASADQLAIWFDPTQANPPDLALLTGRASGIVVLDVDTPALLTPAVTAALSATYTVQTRRGFHYYFASADQRIASRKFAGVDLKAEGGYVVAPPSPGYSVSNDCPPRPISAAELESLIAQLCPPPPARDPAPDLRSTHLTSARVLHLYQQRIAEFGSRNTALFITACHLRDSGAALAWTLDALVESHVHQPDPAGRHESETQRRREALATIRSAYSRPPRLQQPDNPAVADPRARITRIASSDNAAREVLLQADTTSATAFWRCYDGLILAGITGGDSFTHAHARHLLAPLGVGRRALDHFIRATSPTSGELLISRAAPAPSTPPPAAAASHAQNLIDKNAFVPTTKRSELKPGRRPTVYTLPDLATLCARLGVQRSPGDPITAQDVRSPRQYRASLQREFIRRRPGQYSLGLLASRLGVTARSIQRYHTREGVHSAPTFETLCQLTPHDLDVIPPYRAKSSKFFLEDNLGKLYPPRPETARWLLASGKRVFLKMRGYNYYWLGDPPAEVAPALAAPLPAQSDAAWSASVRQRGEAISQLLYERAIAHSPDPVIPLPPITRLPLVDAADSPARPASPVAPSVPTPARRKSKRYYRSALPDAHSERLAQRVSHWTKAQNAQHSMSLVNARRLVETFGCSAVAAALESASYRPKLTHPAGFVVTAARGNYRQLYGRSAPRYEVERRRTNRSQRQRPDAPTECFWETLTWLVLLTDPDYLVWRKRFFASLGIPDHLDQSASFDQGHDFNAELPF